MTQRTWRVSADVPTQTRALILRVHPPMFPSVYLRTVTWAYGVEQSYPFDSAEQDFVLYGLHRGYDTEAFAVRIGDACHGGPNKSDQALFLCLSCEKGIQPYSSGAFDPVMDTEQIAPIQFRARLAMNPNFKVPVHAA